MKKSKYIILLINILLITLYQKAPAQVYGHSTLNAVSGGNLFSPRGSATLYIFNHFSTGSDRFQQTLNRSPDPLAAHMSVNRLVQPQTIQPTGFTRRISPLGLNSHVGSSTRNSPSTGRDGVGAPSGPMSLTSSNTGFNVKAYSSTSTLNYSPSRRFFGASYLPNRPLTLYPSIFTANLPQTAIMPTLLEKKGLLSPNSRGLLSYESNSLVNIKVQSELKNTRLSMKNSFLGATQPSPFLGVRKY